MPPRVTHRILVTAGLAAALQACGGPPVDTAWHQETGYRWHALDVKRGGRAGFTPLAASATGIMHANLVDEQHALLNRNPTLGAGVAVGDVDGDGLPDLFLASIEQPAALYHNDGKFKFTDVTVASGLETKGLAINGAVIADVDGDGHEDILAGTLGGPIKYWHNDGKGHFTDATATSGLGSGLAATTLALADVDGNGTLDLYVATYKLHNAVDVYTPQQRAFDQVVKKTAAGKYEVLPEWQKEYRVEDRPDLGGIVRFQRAERDLFYLNDGKGHFTAQPTDGSRWLDENGKPMAEAPDYFGLSATFYDVNGDGAPDLYVCNDYDDPDQFWLNDGKGGFRLVPRLAVRATSNTCMSVGFGDLNRDGNVDFFTADMLSPTLAGRQRQIPTHTPLPKTIGESPERAQWMRNMLQVSRGDGTWAQMADFAGVAGTDWTWGSAFVDVDLDGFEDLLAVTGHRWDIRDADTYERIRNSFPRVAWNREQGEFPKLAIPNIAMRNNGNLTFSDQSKAWRFGTDSAINNALALGDLDGDGDFDAVVGRLDAPPMIYRNESSAPRVAITLKGTGANHDGIGARVTVRAASLPVQTHEMTSGGAYLSSPQPMLSFATGADSSVTIEVRWRDGRVSTITGARTNRMYEIDESSAVAAPAPAADTTRSLFADATKLLNGQTHHEPAFDDFARQPLLPNRFSQMGPAVAWIDVDGDGREDLVIGDGRDGALNILRNTGSGFSASKTSGALAGDLGGIVAAPVNGAMTLFATQANYEAATKEVAVSIPSLLIVPAPRGRLGAVATALAGDTASMGALALGDVDGDGWPDLFVGARVRPGAWPLPARSRLLKGSATGFAVNPAFDAMVQGLGLVSGATFADLNGDGRADLVVTSEWGPVRVLLNANGRLDDATEKLGLAKMSSRWNGVTAGDFDGDGRLDLVVTSWGRNTGWGASADRPYKLLVGDFGKGVGMLPARDDSVTHREMPLESFSRLGVAIPSVRERIASYHDYAIADAATALGPLASKVIRVGATTFDHLLLLNRGDHFDVTALPDEAQRAPAMAVVVADFDGDGHEDLFLGQNFFPTEIGTLRFDAGQGLILRGDGAGHFTALTVRQSGVSILGDQRGAAAADYDGDGRVDLAVSQNGAATRLLHNTAARPGLRVRVDGGASNPFGVGAQLRVITKGAKGPVREIRMGTGYWSTDGATTVLALPVGAESVEVRWPGGAVQSALIPAGGGVLTLRR